MTDMTYFNEHSRYEIKTYRFNLDMDLIVTPFSFRNNTLN